VTFAIELDRVCKKFDEFWALRDFTERIESGDRISLLGHNGAGKSTLLNMLATLSSVSGGAIRYQREERHLEKKVEIRRLLTYLSHEPMMYPDLNAVEGLRFTARLYGRDISEEEIIELLDRVGMKRARDRLFRTCSRGMQQRLSIARALLPQPELLLLDEPFSGLDTEGVMRFQELFHASDLSWLLVSHDLELAWSMANRFWILHRGRLIHSIRKAELDHEGFIAMARETTMAGVKA